MKSPNLKMIRLITPFLLPMGAFATTYAEFPDAGELLATAQLLPGGTDAVQGSLSSDADLFSFAWGGGAFYVNSVGSSFDSQLFLFDALGAGVQGNDDGIAFAGPAYLQVGALAAGNYYLGVSGYNYDPHSSSGLIFQSFPWDALYGPNNSDPVSSWSGGSGNGGTYSLNFQQITSDGTPTGGSNPTGSAVPDSGSTLLMLGASLLGFGAVRRKFK